MKMTTEKKLTQAPTNLKEAIDWVLRVSGRDGFGGDGTDLLAKALSDHLQSNPYTYDAFVTVIHEEIKDTARSGNGLITALANALEMFIGYKYEHSQPKQWKITGNGIVTTGTYDSPGKYSTYTSAYDRTSWFTDIEVNGVQTKDEKRNTCVINFFIAVEKIFEGLTELYYNCKTEWAGQSLSGSGDEGLKHFMDRNGFEKAKLNSNMTGEQIISKALNGLNEFSTAYDAAGTDPSIDAFRSQLEQNAWSKPSAFPLTALYILATYAYVQSTSPATPSFAGYSGLGALAGGAYGFNLGGLGTFMSALLAYPFIRLSQPLLDCPSNLKEAIDWILRVTVKDTVSGGGDGNGAEGLANSVNDLISTVGIKEIKPPIKIDQTLIDNLATGLAKFVGYDDIKKGQIGDKGIAGVPRGGQANTKNKHPTPWTQEELNKERSSIRIPKGYVYSYEPKTTQWNNQWDNGSHAGAQKCAKIFLACLPMIFSALSYLYWRCSRGYIDDGWQSMSLKDSGLNAGLSYFISGHGFRTSELNGKIAGSGVVSAMTDDNFKDFKTALDQANTVATTRANSENAARTKLGIGQSYMPSHMPRKPFTPVPANNKPTYREFLHELRENGKENSGSSITTNAKHNSFSILFHISCLYFTAKQKRQSTDPAFKPRSPSTIREMLYFLAAFTYSTSYDTLNAHISNHFKNLVPDPDGKTIQEDKRHDAELMIPVADASSPNTNNTLSAADLKDYLLATCLYCPAILLVTNRGSIVSSVTPNFP
ncbi:variant erythrocyte surface antigen-1 family protein [Babesia caballi]|uniref:Variant erythrocyte surface antigen-1 family protein n=1 Tax=Babesia caballi TaxID=5871 RepID=A0AAV4LWW0_BABCB|nr:variant erythrocyte surface antigen-1 family protein [Babesia caballi]